MLRDKLIHMYALGAERAASLVKAACDRLRGSSMGLPRKTDGEFEITRYLKGAFRLPRLEPRDGNRGRPPLREMAAGFQISRAKRALAFPTKAAVAQSKADHFRVLTKEKWVTPAHHVESFHAFCQDFAENYCAKSPDAVGGFPSLRACLEASNKEGGNLEAIRELVAEYKAQTVTADTLRKEMSSETYLEAPGGPVRTHFGTAQIWTRRARHVAGCSPSKKYTLS
jgi:hypothetical protein